MLPSGWQETVRLLLEAPSFEYGTASIDATADLIDWMAMLGQVPSEGFPAITH